MNLDELHKALQLCIINELGTQATNKQIEQKVKQYIQKAREIIESKAPYKQGTLQWGMKMLDEGHIVWNSAGGYGVYKKINGRYAHVILRGNGIIVIDWVERVRWPHCYGYQIYKPDESLQNAFKQFQIDQNMKNNRSL